jgi:amino acid adenylation domain-containing protein
MLSNIWATVLGRERVEVADNFFELGGHSLLATQVVSQTRQLFGVDLGLRDLFATPTIESLAKLVEEVRLAGDIDTRPALVRVDRQQELPLSFAQQRLWFIEQLEPCNAAYNIHGAVKLRGRLEVAALERALAELVQRHEVLRARFGECDGRQAQFIDSQWRGSLERFDLRSSGEGPEAKAKRLIAGEVSTGFDLEKGPLIRAKLLQLDDQEHVLLLTMHHIVSDGWSMGVLVQELATLYDAFVKNAQSPLTELEIQYVDYAVWQREWLKGTELESHLQYWREQLAGVPVLELPTDFSRPLRPSRNGASLPVNLPAGIAGQLRESSRREQVTMFMILLASFHLLLSRWAGQEDVAIGTPIANRSRTELNGIVGLFVNTLVIRLAAGDDPSVRQFLARVRDVCLNAYAHQDLPFERLVEEMNPRRSLNRTPLFQAMFTLQNAPLPEFRMEGLTAERVSQDSCTAKFDLELILEGNSELAGAIVYATELFEAETIERMLRHWKHLLEDMLVDPGRKLSELGMLSEQERKQILVEWNQTTRAYPDCCVHELFEAQAEKTPHSVAVVFEGMAVSYAELNGRANQLAHRLRELGVGAETRVVACMHRGLEMVVALLGILKAGGTYVPLDPEHPVKRLRSMLDDSGAMLVLVDNQSSERLQNAHCQIVDLNWTFIERRSQDNLERTVESENAAYMIYTSGSTGRPKGVIVSHSSLANVLDYAQKGFALGNHSVTGVLASFAFDIFLLELITPWLAGGCSVILSRMEILDVERLVQRLEGVTVFHAVPSLMWQVVKTLQNSKAGQRLAQVRTVLVGGDRVPADLLRDMSSVFAGCSTRVLYGPTESTVICAQEEIHVAKRSNFPIGAPIANTQIYVMDADLNPVPVGVLGELYIGGAGLARGYLNQPQFTAERFIPDPFATAGRLFRTGDLARWRMDGLLEFVRRADEQVKIRGYRIEPGEIEAAMREHVGVEDAAVKMWEDHTGEKHLVAYVVSSSKGSPGITGLKGHLERCLPPYMVPTAYMEIERLPLTPNGKIDSYALPTPDKTHLENQEYVPPRTAVEGELCRIWAEVLGLDRVGVEDNFFALGGHSLLATQVVSQIRQLFGVDLELAVLFETQTVAGLTAKMLKDPQARSRIEKVAEIVQKLNSCSEEQAEELLAQYTVPTGKGKSE